MSARSTGDRAAPLSPAAVELLTWVAEHRLLSSRQLHAMRGPTTSERWTLALLADLERRGLVGHVRSRGARKLWYLTDHGGRVATATAALDRPPKLLSAEEASGALQAHTLAVNDVGIAFLCAARERGDEFGALSWRHEVAHPLTRGRGRRRRQVIADALLTYLLADGERLSLEYRLLELDRATLTVDRLARKLARYAELHHATDQHGQPAWRAWYPTFPAILAVLTGDTRAGLERRRRTVLALCRTDPELAHAQVAISICLLDDLREQGPFAPIFQRPDDPAPANWLRLPERGVSGDTAPGK